MTVPTDPLPRVRRGTDTTTGAPVVLLITAHGLVRLAPVDAVDVAHELLAVAISAHAGRDEAGGNPL